MTCCYAYSSFTTVYQVIVNDERASQIHKFCNRQSFLSDEGPMLETLDYTIRIGSIPTFLYFDLYLYSAYAAHFV